MSIIDDQTSGLYEELENTLARVVHSINSNRFVHCCEELFLHDTTTKIAYETNQSLQADGFTTSSCFNYKGYNEIIKAIEELEKYREHSDTKEISMWASPRFEVKPENGQGFALCDIFTYRINKKNTTSQYQCELVISQLIIKTAYHNNQLKVTDLCWKVIQSMVPWSYDSVPELKGFDKLMESKLPIKVKSSSKAVSIRNLQNKFFERRLHDISDLFSDCSTPSLMIEPIGNELIIGKGKIIDQSKKWLEEEQSNHGFYKFLGITAVPLIEVDEEKHNADGVFMVELIRFVKSSNKDDNTDTFQMLRSICRLEAKYVFENLDWKIQSMLIKRIIDLPNMDYCIGKRYDYMTGEPNSWYYERQTYSGCFPADSYLIENIVNQWGYHCRSGQLEKFYYSYMKNGVYDCKMFFRSQGKKSSPVSTEEAIVARLSGMDRQFTPLMYSYHTATTPVIEIDETGMFAIGTWYDRSATNLLSLSKSRESIPYMALITKYNHRFRKIDGKWYLIDFFAEPIISLPDWDLNYTTSKGFIAIDHAEDLPNPYSI